VFRRILIPVIPYIRSGFIMYKVLMCACIEVLKLGKFDAWCAGTKFGLFSAYGIFIHRKDAKAREAIADELVGGHNFFFKSLSNERPLQNAFVFLFISRISR
jgi:hypothetical protein